MKTVTACRIRTKVLFCWTLPARRTPQAAFCLYARSTRSGGYPLPRRCLCMRVCRESANLMNAYSLVLNVFLRLVPAKRSTPMRCASMICIIRVPPAREMEPPLDAIACEVVRALDPFPASPFRRFRPCCLPDPQSIPKLHFPAAATSCIPYPVAVAQQPAAQPIAPVPTPTPRPVFAPDAVPPSTAQPDLSRRQSGIASPGAPYSAQAGLYAVRCTALPDAFLPLPIHAVRRRQNKVKSALVFLTWKTGRFFSIHIYGHCQPAAARFTARSSSGIFSDMR